MSGADFRVHRGFLNPIYCWIVAIQFWYRGNTDFFVVYVSSYQQSLNSSGKLLKWWNWEVSGCLRVCKQDYTCLLLGFNCGKINNDLLKIKHSALPIYICDDCECTENESGRFNSDVVPNQQRLAGSGIWIQPLLLLCSFVTFMLFLLLSIFPTS